MKTIIPLLAVILGLTRSLSGDASQAFTYDAAGRLIASQRNDGQTITYRYDAAGNIVEEKAVAAGAPTIVPLSITTLILSPVPRTSEVFTMKYRVTHGGSASAAEARNVNVAVTVPAALTVVGMGADQGSAGFVGGVVTYTLGVVRGATVIDLSLTLRTTTPGNYVLPATLTSPSDNTTGDNSVSFNLTVNRGVDLEVNYVASPNPLVLGRPLTLQISVRNKSNFNSNSITIGAGVPSTAAFLSESTTHGTISHTATNFTAALGVLPANTTAMVTFVIQPTIATNINTGTSMTTSGTINTVDDSDSVSIQVLTSTHSVTNTNDSGAGSLRQALLDANAGTGGVISFEIPGAGAPSIIPLTPLPAIANPITLDGLSQQPAGLVEINGNGLVGHGLELASGASFSLIRGLVINRFGGHGLLVDAAFTHVQACRIGTDTTGASDQGNAGVGVWLEDGAGGSEIGGDDAWQRNVISGNNGFGVKLASTVAENVEIDGNHIGLGVDGATNLGNGQGGIDCAARRVLIGPNNVISGNDGGPGIRLAGGAHDAVIRGNLIGLNAAGTAAVPNQGGGVQGLAGALGSRLGGSTSADANTISGNQAYGVEHAGQDAVARGNRVGVTLAGSALANQGPGISLAGATGAMIGGTQSGEGNLIAHNIGDGVRVTGAASANSILGNLIHSNGGTAIDLADDGPTANDFNDTDAGPNNLQNFATPSGSNGSMTAACQIHASQAGVYRTEIFDSPSGVMLGVVNVFLAAGPAEFKAPLTSALIVGQNLVATTTAPDGSTSEHSTPAIVGATALAPLANWKQIELGNANAPNDGDPEGDGLFNLFEYGAGLNPNAFGEGSLQLGLHPYVGGDRLRLIFQRDPAKNDIIYEVMAANHLNGPWHVIASSVRGTVTSGPGYVGGDNASPGVKNVEVQDVVSISAAQRRFLKLAVLP